LQIKLIRNKKPGDGDKPYAISRAYWKAFPDFTYAQRRPGEVLGSESLSLAALLLWAALLLCAVRFLSTHLKAM
jgi:hypothetical protein